MTKDKSVTKDKPEPLGGRRCDRCLCWVRHTEDEEDGRYHLGYCNYASPQGVDMETAEYDGCIAHFILRNDLGLVFDRQHYSLVKQELSVSKMIDLIVD